MKVLVVDDDRTTRQLYGRWLAKAGYEVELAANGRDAIALAGSWQPDGVLVDIILPDLSGIEVLARIKASTPNIPVVLCTWGFGPDVIDRAVAAGATRVLDKAGLKARHLVSEFDSAIAVASTNQTA